MVGKIGFLGGTFDPVHNGHLKLAEEAYNLLSLDKVVFIPAYIPPHKKEESITPIEHRLNMLELAVEGIPFVEISDIEAKKKDVCYTVDTLIELRVDYPAETEFFFIVGSDFLQEYTTWKDYEKLFNLANFVVAIRPGFSVADIPENVRLLEGDFPYISSSDIRVIIKHGEYFDGQIPRRVFNYIRKHGLYKN